MLEDHFSCETGICFARNLIKDVQRRKIKYENNDETVNS